MTTDKAPIKTAKTNELLAKNFKAWRSTQNETYLATAKRFDVAMNTIILWEKHGHISHNNLDKLYRISGIPQALWLLDKEHQHYVEKWLNNDCNIVRTVSSPATVRSGGTDYYV